MTKQEFLSLPNGTKFLMKPNECTPSAVWEFIDMTVGEISNESAHERNLKYAKDNRWNKVLRHLRNTENNHECWVSACFKYDDEPKPRFWYTKKMHLINTHR